MRKTLYLIVIIGFLLGFNSVPWVNGEAYAANDKPHIQDIIGKKTYLMDDGSIWSLINGNQVIHTKVHATAITGDEYEGLGIAADGNLLQWDIGKAPHVMAGQSGVVALADSYWLKSDGTVWNSGGAIKKLEGISLIGWGDRNFAALSRKGELLLQDIYTPGKFITLGSIPDSSSVISLAVYDARVALLYSSGKVVVYETSNFDDNGVIIPVTVAEDAVHIAYTSGDPTDVLLVTRKDGTVWQTGNYGDRWKLTNQAAGLDQIVKTAAFTDFDHFYAMRNDGSWILFDEGEIKPVNVPTVSNLKVSLSNLKPFVGDSLSINTQETYTNGANIKVLASDVDIAVQKPHLLQVQSNGSLKVLGVGQTQVTVTSGGQSKTLTVSASLRNNLKYAKQANGVEWLPAKLVFQALGGVVTGSGGRMEVKLGETMLSFKEGDKNAALNGNKLQLKAAPLPDKAGTLVPASLLTDALGARIQWSSQWKQAEISFGDARMTVISTETAALIKKAAQGSLAKYIGKTYWVNYFQAWDRFSQVTVTDIMPDGSGSFIIVFKSATGQTLKSYSMSSSYVSQTFADGSAFLNYNPYTKYNWTSSIWKQIKNGEVSLGMTKEQVQFSWGNSAAKSVATSSGKTIETWVYSNFDTVSFVNGKVTFIIT